MSKKLYAGYIPWGAMEIDNNRIFSMIGQVVTMRLVTDPHTGRQRWMAFAEMASKVKVKKAIGVHSLKTLLTGTMDIFRRRSVMVKRIILALVAVSAICGILSSLSVEHRVAPVAVKKSESAVDMEIRRIMEKGIGMAERRRQVPAIVAAFARRTDPQRARHLAALCYLKTLGTPFMPLDIAVIALAETGNFGLSARAVSSKGAMGVWQLMPRRAMSHGYSPEEMRNDEKCADAAVRELISKLKMAKGDLAKAKKLYCGVGPAADAYAAKTKEYKKEILAEMGKIEAAKEKTTTDGLKDMSRG
jgi:hypothetical protein